MKTTNDRSIWQFFQQVLAALALLLLTPLLACLYVIVRLESKGAFLFKQERRGLHGKPFRIIKVRTMAVAAESATRLGTTQNGPYVTRVGRVLRILKLDEIPQLWNIARGDMALVGPRPLPIALSDYLEQNIPGFEVRYSIRPGLTNLGQVCVTDNDLDEQLLVDWGTRFEAELHYLQHKSVRYDIVLIALTGLYVLRSFTSHARANCQSNHCDKPVADATRIVTTPISNLNYQGVISHIRSAVSSSQPNYVCVVPVHSIIVALWNRTHRAVLKGASICTADGMPVVWIQRLLGYRSATRVYGPTLMSKVLMEAQEQQWRVAFVGGSEQTLAKLASNVQEEYPSLELVEAYSPPFRPLTQAEDDELVERLERKQAQIIFVGLGCPKQERWMSEHCSKLQATMLGVGAAFDFHAGSLRQSPPVLQKLGLEWAFRLAMEPRRLWKRYATTNPTYVLCAGAQVFASVVLGRNYQLKTSNPEGGMS